MGIDEVGRGPWAGPVVAAAVILSEPIQGLRDSKKLSLKKRIELDEIIRTRARFGLGWVSAREIDRLGLSLAVQRAMQIALDELGEFTGEITIDGNINYLSHVANTRALIGADDSVPEVAAASIIAKVARDNYMKQMDERYPGYDFASNVGYGTKKHKEALDKLGITPIHRQSFKPIAKLI